jgi:deazaflavin-dependent oxidoreductase (nitroreductase family)
MNVSRATAAGTTATREPLNPPRFGGFFWRLARRTNSPALRLAGKRWNPIFAVIVHRGRRTGREHATPVAVRRQPTGFVIALAFGRQVDWHRNLVAAGGGRIRWRGREYLVSAPKPVDPEAGRAVFLPVQRLFLRLAGIDGYVIAPDVDAPD